MCFDHSICLYIHCSSSLILRSAFSFGSLPATGASHSFTTANYLSDIRVGSHTPFRVELLLVFRGNAHE